MTELSRLPKAKRNKIKLCVREREMREGCSEWHCIYYYTGAGGGGGQTFSSSKGLQVVPVRPSRTGRMEAT